MRRSSAVCGDGTRSIEHGQLFPVCLVFSTIWAASRVAGSAAAICYRGAGGAKISDYSVRGCLAAARWLHAGNVVAVDRRKHDAARQAVARTYALRPGERA